MTVKDSRNRNSDAASEQPLELVSVFKEASKDLIIIFFFTRQPENLSNLLRMYRKYRFNLIGPQTKFASGDPFPLTINYMNAKKLSRCLLPSRLILKKISWFCPKQQSTISDLSSIPDRSRNGQLFLGESHTERCFFRSWWLLRRSFFVPTPHVRGLPVK
jgi:hypothetical protein